MKRCINKESWLIQRDTIACLHIEGEGRKGCQLVITALRLFSPISMSQFQWYGLRETFIMACMHSNLPRLASNW